MYLVEDLTYLSSIAIDAKYLQLIVLAAFGAVD